MWKFIKRTIKLTFWTSIIVGLFAWSVATDPKNGAVPGPVIFIGVMISLLPFIIGLSAFVSIYRRVFYRRY
jgi:hypothetical protein